MNANRMMMREGMRLYNWHRSIGLRRKDETNLDRIPQWTAVSVKKMSKLVEIQQADILIQEESQFTVELGHWQNFENEKNWKLSSKKTQSSI